MTNPGGAKSWRTRIGEQTHRTVITADDFMTGLLAALALEGVETLSMRDEDFNQAVADAFTALQTRAAEDGDVRANFTIAVSATYGDSPDVRQAITRSVQRDLVSLDNPEYQKVRLKIDRSTARKYLDKLPGDADLYRAAAQEFLRHYPNFV